MAAQKICERNMCGLCMKCVLYLLFCISRSKMSLNPHRPISRTLMMMMMMMMKLPHPLWHHVQNTLRVWVILTGARLSFLLLFLSRSYSFLFIYLLCVFLLQVYTRSVIDPIPAPATCPDGDAASKALDRQKKKGKMSDEEIMDKLSKHTTFLTIATWQFYW